MYSGILNQKFKTLIFRLSRKIGLFRLTQRLTKRKLLILCYHGFELADEAEFRPKLFMRGEVFAKRLDTICRYGYTVLPLQVAIEQLREGSLPEKAVCLTIDDGFYSVLSCAAPVLKQFGYPATLYVTSYYAAKRTPVFRLVIQYMFWKTSVSALEVSDKPWGLYGTADLTDPLVRQNVIWRIIEIGENQCDEDSRQEISITLGERLEVDYQSIKHMRILGLLTEKEIKQVNDAGIDIQLHTHRHRLPADDEAAVRREVSENADFLERVLGRRATHLCYPSGIWQRSLWPWLSDLGVESATTCEPGFNSADTPALGLYRILDDSSVSQIAFEAELSGFSELLRWVRGRRKRLEMKRWYRPETAQD